MGNMDRFTVYSDFFQSNRTCVGSVSLENNLQL